MSAIKKLKINSAPGLDGSSIEHLASLFTGGRSQDNLKKLVLLCHYIAFLK